MIKSKLPVKLSVLLAKPKNRLLRKLNKQPKKPRSKQIKKQERLPLLLKRRKNSHYSSKSGL